MKIKLRIERLVLDGLPVSRLQGEKVRRTVEHELTQLLTHGGMANDLRSGGAMPALRAGNIRMEKRSQPETVGKQIAGAVYGKIGHPGKREA